MPLETQTRGLPLAVARAVASQCSSMRRASGVTITSLEIHISTALAELLESLNAEQAFNIEVAEVLAAVTGSSVEVRVVADAELTIREVRLKQEFDNSASHLPLSDATVADTSKPTNKPQLILNVDGCRVPVVGSMTIGRSSSCDLALADTEISRRHAQISTGSAGVLLEDLSSTNGTFVNGIRITTSQPIVAGDLITVGTTNIDVVRA